MSETLRALGLAGSPRRHGNTEILLDRFLEQAASAGAQARKIVISQLNIAGCGSCGACYIEGVCAVEDEFQRVRPVI